MAQMGLETIGRHERSVPMEQDCTSYRLCAIQISDSRFPHIGIIHRWKVLQGNTVDNRTDNKAKLRDTKMTDSILKTSATNTPIIME